MPIVPRAEIRVGEQCHPGLIRDENQDSVAHGCTSHGEIFVISDGVGGYAGGAEASGMITKGLLRHLQSLSSAMTPEQAVSKAMNRVNAEVYAAAQTGNPSRRRMSATVVFALVIEQPQGWDALIGNIGDSRAYLLRAGELTQLSTDHTAVQGMIRAGVLAPEQAEGHPHANVLTQSVGQSSEVVVTLRRVSLLPGDELLLCSDGLHGYVKRDALRAVLTNYQADAPAQSRALVDLALAAGGLDNISVQVLKIDGVGTDFVSQAHAQGSAIRRWLSNPVVLAALGGSGLVLASWGGLAAYQVWQAAPVAVSAGLPPSVVGGSAPSENKPVTSASPAPAQAIPAPLSVAALVPESATEQDWLRSLRDRPLRVADVDSDHYARCSALIGDRPTAYYRDASVLNRAPTNDTAVKQHYLFQTYRSLTRESCGDFDLLLLPARNATHPGALPHKIEGAKSGARKMKEKVAGMLGRAPSHP